MPAHEGPDVDYALGFVAEFVPFAPVEEGFPFFLFDERFLWGHTSFLLMPSTMPSVCFAVSTDHELAAVVDAGCRRVCGHSRGTQFLERVCLIDRLFRSIVKPDCFLFDFIYNSLLYQVGNHDLCESVLMQIW
jgi:hypothetical protein